MKVGELHALLTLDRSQFDKGVDGAGQKWSGFTSAVKSGTQTVATAFAGTVTAAGALGAAVMATGLNYNRLQQTSRAALSTLLGGAEQANAQMDKLDEFAKTSPFAKDVFITAQQQMLGFGIEAQKVIPYLDAVQQAVAATGGSSQQLSEVTFVLSQMSAAGKITATDLMQLGQRGINAAELIGQSMGKTGPEIRKMITEGILPVDVALDALTDGMQEKFGGATANIKAQFDGAADRVKAAFRDIGSVVAAPFIDPNGGGYLVTWTNKVADGMRALEAKTKPLVDLLVDRFGPGMGRVVPALEKVEGAINSWDLSKVNGELDELTQYAPLLGAVGTALFAMGANGLGMAKLGISLNPVVAGLAALVALSPELRGALSDTLSRFEPLVPLAGDLGEALADLAVYVLANLTPALGDLLVAGADVATNFGVILLPAVKDLVGAAEPLVDVLADVVGWVADIPTPVLGAAAAFVALHGPLGNVATALTGGLKTAFANAGEYISASKATVEAMGGQVTVMGTAAMGARAGVNGLGTALKTAFISNPIGIAILGITTAIGFFVSSQGEARQSAEELTTTLDDQTGALTENSREWVYNRLEKEGVVEQYRELGGSTRDLVGYLMGEADAIANVDALMATHRETVKTSAGETVIFDEASRGVAAALMIVGDEMVTVQEKERERIDATREGTGATEAATGATNAHADALKAQQDALDDSAASAMSLKDAQLRQKEQQDQLNAAIAEGTTVTRDQNGALDQNAASTRAAEKELLGMAQANETTRGAMQRNNAAAGELNTTIQKQRQDFINNAVQMGYTRGEAIALADAYGMIPNKVTTYAEFVGADGAMSKVSQLKMAIDGIPRNVTITANARVEGMTKIPGFAADGAIYRNNVKAYANGGVENHVAQMAPAGAWRVWAEDETGGESYIPHALGKRARSEEIMARTAAILGGQYIPSTAVKFYADGATNSTSSAPAPVAPGRSAPLVHVEHIHARDEDAAARALLTVQQDAVNTYLPDEVLS